MVLISCSACVMFLDIDKGFGNICVCVRVHLLRQNVSEEREGTLF